MRRTIALISLAPALAFAHAAQAATTASVTATTLTVDGSPAADQITVRLPGGDGITPDQDGRLDPPNLGDPYYVEDPAGVIAGPGCSVDMMVATRLVCSRNGASHGSFSVRVNGADGSDWILAIRPIQAYYDVLWIGGGAGDDALFGSQTGDVIAGDAGDDLLDGGAGMDLLSGGTFVQYVPTPEGGVHQPASYTPGPGAGRDRVYGGNFDDQITDGDNDADPAQLDGDVIDGGVCAGPQGPGEAMPAGLPAGAPATCPALTNNIDGPEDHDAYMLGHRTLGLVIDVLVPGPSQGAPGENEQIRRIEAVWGGSGSDRLYGRDGDLGDDSLRGNGGSDHLEARGGDDELLGGDGQDVLLGGKGADVIRPGGHIVSAPGAPTVMVSDGPDYVDAGENSTITGGHAISDLVSYDGRTDPLRIDMTRPNTLGAPGEGDTILGVEDVMGGYADDVIIGDAVQNLISGDPQPYVVNVPPDPPEYPAPPSAAGNDHVTTRDSGPDTVDCTAGGADVHITDAVDATINCETVDRGPVPAPAPTGPAATSDKPAKATISGRGSAGTIRVSSLGSFRLSRHVVRCPQGPTCKVSTSVATRLTTPSARKARLTKRRTTRRNRGQRRTYRLGTATYPVKARRHAGIRGKLNKKGRSALTRLGTARVTVTVRVLHGSATTTKQVTATLRPAKKATRR